MPRMRAMTKKVWPEMAPYTGELERPLRVSLLADDAELQRQHCEWVKRFGLLVAHYGVDISQPGAWEALAINLAYHHVPGLQLEPVWPTGRPKEKTGEYELGLRRAVALVSQKHGTYGAASRAALLLAEARVEHSAKTEGSPMSRHQKKIEIDRESRQLRNEISSLKKRTPK
jgi:hypothetical protein